MSQQRRVTLDGRSLTLEDLAAVSRQAATVGLASEARELMSASRTRVQEAAAGGHPVYGVNTGFGHLANVSIATDKLQDLQRNLVRSHCAGVGQQLERHQVRAAMVLRANALARGHSGIRPQTVALLLDMLNAGIHPRIPSQGSVGASGDLAPLAHMAAAMLGEGNVEMAGSEMPAATALQTAALEPVSLAEKEGLALINGTQVSTAIGALAVYQARTLAQLADVSGAMSLEGLRGSLKAFDARVQEIRPQPGQQQVADNLRRLAAGSTINESHRDCGQVQDSYALRCMPQVHGAVRHTLSHAKAVLTTEINSTTDNPVVFADTGEMISCGNFHGAPVGYVFDFVAIALADLAAMAERRIERLVNPGLSGLPAFLTADPGLHSGFMLAQVTAASLVSENKTLAHPASVDSIPTSADKEDHVSMSTWAARKLTRIIENVAHVLAIEILAAAQALDLLLPLHPGAGVGAAHKAVRTRIDRLGEDRPLAPDIEATRELMEDNTLKQSVEQAIGVLL